MAAVMVSPGFDSPDGTTLASGEGYPHKQHRTEMETPTMSNDRRNPVRLADKRRTLERRKARQNKQAIVALPVTPDHDYGFFLEAA